MTIISTERASHARKRTIARKPAARGEGESLRLTALSSCAGCAAKLGQAVLRELVRELPETTHPRLLVGANTADDAAIYQLDATRALVQTVDFFTPIVDDPFEYGRIAATNALSDVYAMGGRPITAMNLLGFPSDVIPPAAAARILLGGAAIAAEADVPIVGGHTIRAKEPIYGLSVTGLVHPRRMITNAAASPGDLLVLTKPLGVGIVTTALKRGVGDERLEKRAIALMTTLNRVGADIAEQRLARAGTDITGFGLMGHLGSLCRASGVAAEISFDAVPVLDPDIRRLIREGCVPGGTRTNLAAAEEIAEWPTLSEEQRILLCDAQTSGGLLLCVQPKRLDRVLELLRQHRTPAAAVIGKITRTPHASTRGGSPAGTIRVR
ncbi:MAG: selenide, water dikinase SelD [Phycisphaerae bacterium]